MAQSTLSIRGAELAQGPNMRDLAGSIFGEPWNPVKNPDVIVNIGTAENVSSAVILKIRIGESVERCLFGLVLTLF